MTATHPTTSVTETRVVDTYGYALTKYARQHNANGGDSSYSSSRAAAKQHRTNDCDTR